MKRSAVPGKVPTTEQLELGELAVNTHDGKIYFKKNNGSEQIVDATPPQMTADEVFTRVLERDGAGSGLDADLLDGQQASAFALLAGATFTGDVAAPNFVSSSDARLKANIEPIANALGKVIALDGVTFEMKGADGRQMGLIAQEVQIVAPEVVSDVDGVLRLAYGNLVGLLIEAIKELHAQIKEMQHDH
jgi:hypothetical protein